MPPLVIALAAYIGTFAATLVVNVLVMVALQMVVKMFAPSSSQGTQLSDGISQEYSGTVEPRRIVYGENLIAGLNAIPPWCHGNKNEMLDQVLVLAGHECQSITDVYFNQERIPSGSMAAVTHGANDGLVSTGTFANKAWVRRYTGAQTEQADYILLMAWVGYWDGYCVGKGLAKLFLQFQYDATAYSGGKPEIRALVKGKKCYDPRLDTSPGAHPANASYVVYTNNAALCIIDYITDPILGIGEEASRIDWTMAVVAANICDEQVAIPGAKTQPRYTCNTVLDCTASYEDNLKALAGSMNGAVLYSSGKWVLRPGRWQTGTFAIGDDDIAGAINYQTALPYADRYNAVRGQFYDPANLYSPNEYPSIRVSADEEADGEGPVWREYQQPTCIDTFEAQRNAIILQRQSRRKKTWSFPAMYSLYAVRPGDYGTLTISELDIVGQLVRCTGWKMDGKLMTMALALEEVSPSDWNDPAPAVYQTADSLATPAPAWFISDPPTNFSAVSGAGGITFKWTLPDIWHSNLTVELIESDVQDISHGQVIWAGVNTGVFIQKEDTATRYYWVRIRNIAGNTVSGTAPLNLFIGLAAAANAVGMGPKGDPGIPGLPGTSGTPGLVGSLTLQAIVLPATGLGHVTSYAGASGRFVVYEGETDVSAGCTYGLAPEGNLSGLSYTLAGVPVGTTTWDSSVTFDTGAAQTWDGAADAAVTGVAGGARWAIVGGMPDGADSATLTLRATYHGAFIDQTIFVGKAKSGVAGADGPSGAASVTVNVSRDVMMVMCYAEGTPVDPSFLGMDGFFTLSTATDDVTWAATVSAVTTGCTGTVNTALNVPVAAHAKGYYRITAMDAAADTAKMVISALYQGITYIATINIAKAKGGYEIVAVLPTANLFDGRVVYLTTDHKLYRYDISLPGWTAAVNAFDITGVLQDAQIAALAASKITGQLTDDQVAGIAAAKLTGQIVKTQIGDGQIDTPQLAAGAVKAGILYAGAVVTGDIATDAVVAGNIHSGAVVAATIAAGQVQTGHMVANSIDGSVIQANTLDAHKITSYTITSDQLSTGQLITASAQIAYGVIISANIGTLQVKEANIENLTVGTGKIKDFAASRLATAVLGGENGAAGLVLSLAYTPDTPSPIKLDWTLNNRIASGTAVTFSIKRLLSGAESTLATEVAIGYGGLGSNPAYVSSGGTFIDNVGSLTPRTYEVYQTGGALLVGSSLVAQEIKK